MEKYVENVGQSWVPTGNKGQKKKELKHYEYRI